MEIIETIQKTHPFLQNMFPGHVVLLLKDAVPVEFAKDQIILKQGDYADKFYLIHSGRVAVECHSAETDIPIGIIGPNDTLGWSWLFAPFTWHFQARALEPTVALQLHAPQLLIAAEEDPSFGYEMMKRIAQIAIRRMQQARNTLIEAHHRNPIELGSLI